MSLDTLGLVLKLALELALLLFVVSAAVLIVSATKPLGSPERARIRVPGVYLLATGLTLLGSSMLVCGLLAGSGLAGLIGVAGLYFAVDMFLRGRAEHRALAA